MILHVPPMSPPDQPAVPHNGGQIVSAGRSDTHASSSA